MDNGVVYISKAGYEKLRNQLIHLKTVRRKEITVQLQDARAQGDLSENAEYDAAKEAQALNEIRIGEVEGKLASARIMDDMPLPDGKALLGTTVTIKDLKTKEQIEYKLVSELEADFAEDKISVSSPVGRGLLGHAEGDKVEIKVPAGIIKYEILTIARTV